MKAICAWCSKSLGHRPPLSNRDTTHGICVACRHRFFAQYIPASGEGHPGLPRPHATRERRRQLADERWLRRRARRLGQLSFSAGELRWLAGRARDAGRAAFAEALEHEAGNKAGDEAWR